MPRGTPPLPHAHDPVMPAARERWERAAAPAGALDPAAVAGGAIEVRGRGGDPGMAAIHPLAQASRDAAQPAPPQVVVERVNLVIVPDALHGSDKKTHDAYIPAYLRAQAGQQVIVTIYNLDTSPHSFTSPALGVNVIVPGAKNQGLEGTTSFSFTARKAGTYHWTCILPCDNGG